MFSFKSFDNNHPSQFSKGYTTSMFHSMDYMAMKMLSCAWSPSVFKEGCRKESNFLYSYCAGLDFDDGKMTVTKAIMEFHMYNNIIGVTKSHKVDKGGVACDRFRVVLFWDKKITDLKEFKYNMKLIAAQYPIDKKATDGARFFYPCKEIININKTGAAWAVKEAPADYLKPMTKEELIKNLLYYQGKKKLPPIVHNFLTKGEVIKQGRNYSCFIVACQLFTLGYLKEEIVKMIEKAPFDRKDFSSREILSTVSSAQNRTVSHLATIQGG